MRSFLFFEKYDLYYLNEEEVLGNTEQFANKVLNGRFPTYKQVGVIHMPRVD
jgi:hypothetical protein